MTITSFPWENNEKPYFVNEQGFEWYIDKETTNYAKPLKVVCFFCKKKEFMTRVLLNENGDEIYSDTSLE